MSSISGLEFDYNKKNITGIYEITDGGGSTLINGVINCNSLYIGGVPCLPGTTGTPGPQGPSGTIVVGQTVTLAPGTNAYVTDTGTISNRYKLLYGLVRLITEARYDINWACFGLSRPRHT